MKNKWLIGIVSAALAVTLSFGLAACGGDDEATAQDVITEIKDITDLGYTYDTPADYEVNGQWKLGDETYPITWSVAAVTEGVEISDYVTVGEMDAESSMVTISVTQGAIDVVYKLTATVTVGSASASVDFEHKVPASKILGADVTFDFAGVKNADYAKDTGTYIDCKITAEQTLAILQAAGGANSNLVSVDEATQVYGGSPKNKETSNFDGGITTSDGYLKFGSGSANGVLTLTFSKGVSRVAINAQGWSSGSNSIRVNEETPQALTTEPADYAFDIDPTTQITIRTANRAFIFKIAVTFAAEGAHVHKFDDITTGEHVAGTWTHTVQCTAEGCTAPDGKVARSCEPVLNECPVCGYTYTATEILARAKAGETMSGTYSLSGTVDADATESKGDWSFYFTVEGTSDSVQARYVDHNGFDTLPKAGDTVTLQGPISLYNTTVQFNYGLVTNVVYNGEGGGSGGGDDDGPTTDEFHPLESPVAGTYYLAMKAQDNVYHYITGDMATYYFATTTNPAEALQVVLASDDNTNWTIKTTTNQYIEIEVGAHVNAKYKSAQTAGKYWTWDTAASIFVWTEGSEKYFLENYDSNTSIGAGSYSKYISSAYKAVLGSLEAPDPDQTAVDGAKAALTLTTTQYSATGDYDLPTTVTGFDGVAVTWALKADTTFANGTVEGNKLKINSLPTDADATVQLTATFTKNGKTATKDYSVTILKPIESDADKADAVLALITELEETEFTATNTQGIDLPQPQNDYSATISWDLKEGPTNEYVSVAGNKLYINKLPASGEVSIVLTVKVVVGESGENHTKDFTIKVIKVEPTLALTKANTFPNLSGSTYAPYDGSHTVDEYEVVTSNVSGQEFGTNNAAVFQFKSSDGALSVAGKFSKVTVTYLSTYAYATDSGKLTVSSGTSALSPTTVDIDVDTGAKNGNYDIKSHTVSFAISEEGVKVVTIENKTTYTVRIAAITFTLREDAVAHTHTLTQRATQIDEDTHAYSCDCGYQKVENHVYADNADTTCEHCDYTRTIESATWTMVTSDSQLVAGAKIVLVYGTAVNGALSGSYLKYVTGVELNAADKTATLPAGAQELTLGGSAGAWTFSYDNKTLYLTSSSNNKLALAASPSANYRWSISVTSAGVATIESEILAGCKLQCNTNGGQERFSNYKTGTQKDPTIYVKS